MTSLTAMLFAREDDVETAYWPASLAELSAFREELCRLWVDISAAFPDRRAGIAAHGCIAHLLVDALRLFEANLVCSRAIEAKRTDDLGNASPIVRAIAGDAPLPAMTHEIGKIMAAPVTRKTRWRTLGQRVTAALRGDPLPVRRPDQIRLDGPPVCVARGEFIERNARTRDDRPVYCDPYDFLAPASPPRLMADDDLVDAFLAAMDRATRQAGLDLNVRVRADFRASTARMIGAMAGYLHSAEAGKLKLPKTIWVNSALSRPVRIISTLVRAAGGTVVAHDHGTGEGWSSTLVDSSLELDHADRFVTFAEGQAEGYRSNPKRLPLPNSFGCDVIAMSERRPQAPVRRRRVRNVLVLGSLYRNDRVTLKPLPAAPLYADWHYRLLRRLDGWGYSATLRPHPQNKSVPQALAPFLDPHRNIEQALAAADAVIVDYPQTSAFRQALESGVPVTVVEFGLYALSERARKLAQRRLSLVPGWFDGRHRPDCDWTLLRDGIEACPSLGDSSFLETYFTGAA